MTRREGQRIASQIGEYEARGFHRTGANVDRLSGEWLADEVTKAGATAGRESFQLSRSIQPPPR